MGDKGSLLAFKNNKFYISVVPDVNTVDPTGAGDSFAGGVLGYIAKNGLENPINAIKHGSVVASYTVSGFGTENLCKLTDEKFEQKLNQIKIK